MQDENIVQLLCDRDEEGLELLAQKYERLLVYIAFGILKHREDDIEECVNDTYFKIWNHIQTFDLNKASLKTYLKVIVRNTAINRLRELSRREAYVRVDNLSELAESYVDYRQNVEAQIVRTEEIEWMNQMMFSLKKKDRELMLRRYFYLENSKEIAQAMKMSVNAVDSKLSRLRSKFRHEFEGRD